MGTISVTLPSDGQTADVADVNTPITTIVTEINGNLDNDNIKANAGISGSKIADSTVSGAKISTYKVLRQNHTTNITETTAIMQSGWKYGTPGVSNVINFTVTFPNAFTNVPIVTTAYGGDTAGATTTLGAGGLNVNNAFSEGAQSVTTTGFTVRIKTDGGNWAAGNTVYMHWIAIGA